MRTVTVAIAILLGAAAPAFPDARILSVDGAAQAPAAEPPQPQPPEPPPQTQPGPPPARAEEAAPTQPAAPPTRFSFEPSQNGYLRLDHETGQVAYCSGGTAGWTCEAVPEQRAALEKEIGRLQNEVAALKREIAALREPPPPPRPPAELTPPPPAPKDADKGKEGDKGSDLTIRLPTQEDIDRATAALQRAWGRVLDMIGQLKNDLTRKTPPDRTTL